MSMNFDPSKLRTDSTFKGKPLKRQVKKTIFWNGKQKYELASIPKENLSFAPFQRPKDSPRQNKIAENFHKDFALANVAEEFHNGRWYYTVTDAQQRSYANPEDRIGCVVTNGMPPADAFMLGNSNGKPLTKDDKLWARFEMGENDHLWFFDTISSYGFTPYRATGDDGKINKSLGRFIGKEQEPRPGLPSGHIPNSSSLPSSKLINEENKLIGNNEIKNILLNKNIKNDEKIIATCGSGVSACVIALAFYCLGNERVSIYDGSWTEWASKKQEIKTI